MTTRKHPPQRNLPVPTVARVPAQRPLAGRPTSTRRGLKWHHHAVDLARRHASESLLDADTLDRFAFVRGIYKNVGGACVRRQRRRTMVRNLRAAGTHYRMNGEADLLAFDLQWDARRRVYVIRHNIAALLAFNLVRRTLGHHRAGLRYMARLIEGQDWKLVADADQRQVLANEHAALVVEQTIINGYNGQAIAAGLPLLPT